MYVDADVIVAVQDTQVLIPSFRSTVQIRYSDGSLEDEIYVF